MIGTRTGRLGCALLFAGMAAASAQDRVVAPPPSLAPLVERVSPAVVNITAVEFIELQDSLFGEGDDRWERFLENVPDLPPERRGAGSGVIVDAEQGHVLTNHHVIAEANEIHVVLTDNRSFEATVVGSDPESDVAVLQIDADGLTAARFASTDDLRVGDYVVAIGNPFGLGQTVTSGIVSAVGRTSGGFSGDSYEDFIQTDASINVGNSGGALINLNGDLVGINSAIISRTGDSVGIGFAIPSEMALAVMDRLLEFGEVPRGLLGVYMDSVTPSFAEDYGLGVDAGALVVNVEPDSAAETAGIRINDVITGVDGEPVTDSNELRNLVAMKLPGERVSVQIVRDGRERSIDAVLTARPSDLSSVEPRRREGATRPSVFSGVELMAESGRNGGLRVVDIDGDATRMVRGNLQRGDLITAINQQDIGSVADAMRLTDDARTVVLRIERNSRPQLIRLR